MSPYASPVLVVNKKSQHPSAELSDMISCTKLISTHHSNHTSKLKRCIGTGAHNLYRPNLG